MIYLDAAAAAPIRSELLDFIQNRAQSTDLGAGELWGYPLSPHAVGAHARSFKARAEEAILKSLGLSAREYRVAFYSSGSEALEVGARTLSRHFGTWSAGPQEHPFVRGLQAELQASRAPIAARHWASFIYGQNETGLTSHTLSAILSPQTNAQALLLDCIASWGKADLSGLGGQGAIPLLIAIQSNKIGGLPGASALVYPQKLAPLWSPITGAASRNTPRPGGENLLGVASFVWLAENLSTIREDYQTRIGGMRDRFEQRLRARLPQIRFTHEFTAHAERLPHVSHFFVPAAKPLDLVTKLDLRGFCVSAGSACSSGSPEPSAALLEAGWNKTDALNAIRVSLSASSRDQELELLVETLGKTLDP